MSAAASLPAPPNKPSRSYSDCPALPRADANNCGCNEHQNVASWGAPVSHGKTDGIHHYEGEIQATIDFGFDGIKLDGCGEFRNLTVFAELMNKTGRPILVEDCHWGENEWPSCCASSQKLSHERAGRWRRPRRLGRRLPDGAGAGGAKPEYRAERGARREVVPVQLLSHVGRHQRIVGLDVPQPAECGQAPAVERDR